MNKSVKSLIKSILSIKKNHIILISLTFILSISIISAQRFFNSTLSNELEITSAELLTAELEIASIKPLDKNIIENIEKKLPKFKFSERQIFSTMATFRTQKESKLVELVSVTNEYPLRGKCLVKNKDNKILTLSNALAINPNGVIISEELKRQQDINYGDHITIGNFKGVIVGIIESEPDINIQSLALGPRIYTSITNTKKTGFNQQLSRIYYSRFYSFYENHDVSLITKTIESLLSIQSKDKTIQGSYGPSQPIIVRSYLDLTENIIDGFKNLNEFYLFISLFTISLCATGFAFIIWSSIISQLKNIGNLRFLGISTNNIQSHYLKQVLKLSIIITTFGIISGIIFSQVVYNLIAKISNFRSSIIHISLSDICFISIFSILVIVSITYFILKIINKPIQMSHFLTEQKSNISLSVIMILTISILIFMTIFLKLNGVDFKVIGIILLIFTIIFTTLLVIDHLIFPNLKYLYKTSFSIQFRLAMKCLSESHTLRRLSFFSISLALITILSIGHYEKSLKQEFSPTNNKTALPSLFIIDLYKSQLQQFNSLISQKTKLALMIQTRIKTINNIPIKEYAKQLSNDYFLFREQNLSSRNNLYKSEKIVKGKWFNFENDIIEASIEERFAKRLKLKIGDQLVFEFLNQPFSVKISNIRQVNWGTFEPNFFILVEPPFLDRFPQNWIGSIYSESKEETESIQRTITKHMPNVTIIDIKKTSEKVFDFLKTFLISIKVGSLMCLIIGALLFILLSKLYQDYRKESFSMLYWIGLSKNKINQITMIEQIGFAIITFTVSIILSHLIINSLCYFIIKIPFTFNWYTASYVCFILLSSTILFAWTNRYER